MQIDFHHAVTYVAARAAAFDHPEAEKIAYCASMWTMPSKQG